MSYMPYIYEKSHLRDQSQRNETEVIASDTKGEWAAHLSKM